MKKITIQRAVDLLQIMANGGNPEEATVEEVMLAAAMGATAIANLGRLGTAMLHAGDLAMELSQEVKRFEGDEPVNRLIVPPVNGS